MNTTFPTLYKKTNTGAIQYWKTWTFENAVHTEFGQLDTDKPQHTVDVVRGKNIGKKNETSDIEQAAVQAKQHWDKQVKKGYSESLEKAEAGDTGLEGIKPMLAQKYEDREKEVLATFDRGEPVLVQPKLDGIRCVSVCKGGKVTLYTRTQKKINTVPHIVEQLEQLAKGMGILSFEFDGELYCHKFSDNFNEFISIVRRDELHENHKVIEYHIYDTPTCVPTSDRLSSIVSLSKTPLFKSFSNLKVVETGEAYSKENIDQAQMEYIQRGYEGLMVRLNGPYEHKRSKFLLKYKNFQDDEFKVIGVEEGNGKLIGHVGSFICQTEEGKIFNCKLKGPLSDLKYYFDNKDEVIGKLMTVQYFELTPDRVPRFPVGVRFREEGL